MIDCHPLGLDGVMELRPKKFGDARGFFSETYNITALKELGVHVDFVQDNHSLSSETGVLRGLHFQTPPFAQDKLVRVVRGAIFDVAVDIRHGSPDFGKWVGIEISAKKWNQILVPKGFAHGFVTLSDNTEVIYKVSAPYAPGSEAAIRYNDPDIGIEWPIPDSAFTLSDKDANAGFLADTHTGFTYDGAD